MSEEGQVDPGPHPCPRLYDSGVVHAFVVRLRLIKMSVINTAAQEFDLQRFLLVILHQLYHL